MIKRIIYKAKNIYEIPLDFYKDGGFTNILFDFDNTIDSYKAKRLNYKFLELTKNLNDLGIKTYVVSNGAKKRLNLIFNSASETIKYASKLFKPLAKRFDQFILKNKIDLSKTLYIGDQFMTDYLLSRKRNISFILCDRLTNEDQLSTKINRIFERRFLKSSKTIIKDYKEIVNG